MQILKARIYDMQMQEAKEKEMSDRKDQVGTGDRSGRIRTYNYPQNRISDHRINLTLYRLEEIMQGGLMDDIIEPLIADTQAQIMERAGL
jgi:peptide chain release factor 1